MCALRLTLLVTCFAAVRVCAEARPFLSACRDTDNDSQLFGFVALLERYFFVVAKLTRMCLDAELGYAPRECTTDRKGQLIEPLPGGVVWSQLLQTQPRGLTLTAQHLMGLRPDLLTPGLLRPSRFQYTCHIITHVMCACAMHAACAPITWSGYTLQPRMDIPAGSDLECGVIGSEGAGDPAMRCSDHPGACSPS